MSGWRVASVCTGLNLVHVHACVMTVLGSHLSHLSLFGLLGMCVCVEHMLVQPWPGVLSAKWPSFLKIKTMWHVTLL